MPRPAGRATSSTSTASTARMRRRPSVSLDTRSDSRAEVSAGWEAEAQLAAVDPGDRGGVVGEAGVDEDGVVGADVEVDGERVGGGVDGAGGVEEVAPDAVGGGVLVARQAAGEQAVEVA